jgi:hypothetical protein
MTWFEDQLCFTVIGQHPPARDRIFARFGFKASDPVVLSIFHGQIERWLNEWVGVGKYSVVTDVEKNVSIPPLNSPSLALLPLFPSPFYLLATKDIYCDVWRRRFKTGRKRQQV